MSTIPFTPHALYTITGMGGRQTFRALRDYYVDDSEDKTFTNVVIHPRMNKQHAKTHKVSREVRSRIVHGNAIWNDKPVIWIAFHGHTEYTMDCAPCSLAPPGHTWTIQEPLARFVPTLLPVFQELFTTYVNLDKHKTIILIGNSAGANAAAVWGAWIAHHYPSIQVHTVLTGMARVLTNDIVDHMVKMKNLHWYNFQRPHDMVISIPPRWGNCSFRHLPDTYYIDAPWSSYQKLKEQDADYTPSAYKFKNGEHTTDSGIQLLSVYTGSVFIIAVFSCVIFSYIWKSTIFRQLAPEFCCVLFISVLCYLYYHVRQQVMHCGTTPMARQLIRNEKQFPHGEPMHFEEKEESSDQWMFWTWYGLFVFTSITLTLYTTVPAMRLAGVVMTITIFISALYEVYRNYTGSNSTSV